MKTSIPLFSLRLSAVLSLVTSLFSTGTAALLSPVVHARTTNTVLPAAAAIPPGRAATWGFLTTTTTTTPPAATVATTPLVTDGRPGRAQTDLITPTTTTATIESSQSSSSPPPPPPLLLLLQAPPPPPPPILNRRSDPSTNTETAPSTITPFTLPSGVAAGEEKWYLTTYWSCVTDDVQTHCGWHEPVLPGGDDSVSSAVLRRPPWWGSVWVAIVVVVGSGLWAFRGL